MFSLCMVLRSYIRLGQYHAHGFSSRVSKKKGRSNSGGCHVSDNVSMGTSQVFEKEDIVVDKKKRKEITCLLLKKEKPKEI